MATEEKAAVTVESAKADLATAKENHKKFLKANNIKEGVTPKDEKIASKLAQLETKVEKAEKALKGAKKAEKPKKEKVAKASKYEYPADITTADARKKYRALKRAEGKKAENAAKKAEKAAAGKVSKDKSAKPVKKEEKPKTKKVAVEAED